MSTPTSSPARLPARLSATLPARPSTRTLRAVHPLQPLAAAVFAAGLFPFAALAESAEAAERDEAVLPEVAVVTSGAASYNPDEAGGATRTDTPLREVPQAVRVVPRAMIDDIGATRLEQTFDYVSGIARQDSFGGLWDNFAVRGFAGNENTGTGYLVNGFVANRGFTAPRDVATIERVEVLKGPTSSLYGSGEPGGTLNLVTKQPQFKPAQNYEVEVGNRDRYRVAADVTGPLGENVAGRLIAVGDHQGSQRAFVDSQRYLLAPSLTWTLGANTVIQYAGEWQRFSTPLDRGIVAVDGRLDAVGRKTFLGEPTDGDIRLDSQSHQLGVEHQFSPAWKGRLSLAYRGGSLEGYSTEPFALSADDRTLRRQRRYRDYQSDDTALQADLTGRIDTGPLSHTLLVGLDAYRFSSSQVQLRGNPTAAAPYPIDIYEPVYGATPPPLLPNTDTHERQTNIGLYAQDQIAFGERWRVLGGLRVDSYRQTLDNRLRGTRVEQDQTAVSPRLGLAYLASNNVTLFANASRSFRPNPGSNAAGEPFTPERGRAVEAGLKFETDDRRLGATLSAFSIHKRNVLTADPADPSFSTTAGEARSRGLELDVAGRVGQHWRVSGSVALTDAEITADTRLPAGTPLRNIPRTSASALAVYEDAAPWGQRYGVGAGVRYIGKRSGDSADSFTLPSYTLVDLLAYWQLSKQARLTLNVHNLFDRDYYASSYSALWIAPGAGRTIRLGLRLSY